MPARHAALRIDERVIDDIVERYIGTGEPGAAVGIAVGDQVVYRKAFGLASMETGTPLTPRTRMRIQSGSKQFTCLAYLLLCERGLARIDDPLRHVLPEVHPVADHVTMLDLMAHTSGLREAQDIRYQFSGMDREVPSSALVDMYASMSDTEFAAGTDYAYNNGAYHLLSAVIERVSGMSLEDYFATEIFRPIGMHDTVLRRSEVALLPNAAINHIASGQGRFERSPAVGALVGNGGIASTLDDMLRWLIHMDRPVVGNADSWSLMRTARALPNGASTGYGLGLVLDTYRGIATVAHPGGTVGSNSQTLKIPSCDLSLEILVNRHDVSSVEIGNLILDSCLALPPSAAVPAPRPGIIGDGVYRSAQTGRVARMFRRQGAQFAHLNNLDVPLAMDDHEEWRPTGAFASMPLTIIEGVADDETPWVSLIELGRSDRCDLIVGGQSCDAGSVIGSFDSRETGTRLVIDGDAAANPMVLHMVSHGQFGVAHFSLDFVAERLWKATSTDPILFWAGGLLAFDPDYRTLGFSGARTRDLRFVRSDGAPAACPSNAMTGAR